MIIIRIIGVLAAVGVAIWGFVASQLKVEPTSLTPLANTAASVAQGTADMLQQTATEAIPDFSNLTNTVRNFVSSIPVRDIPTLAGRAVPFTTQAPFGNWADPREEDGCEEASLIMAAHWLDGTTITQDQALTEILELSHFSEKTIGEWRSTNAEDTARLFETYYHYNGAVIKHDITIGDVKQELKSGNLILVPTNGQKLGNPHYKQPGPLEHMIVIYAYDEAKDEFVTNDPGTKYGQGYRYSSTVLAGALYDYPTGYRTPVEHPRTAMISVHPKPKN